MRPQLYLATNADGIHHAFLVDGDQYFAAADENGKTRHHNPATVLLGPYRVGEILKNESGEVIFPIPAMLEQRKAWAKIPLAARGLTDETAAVLLHLSASCLNVTTDRHGWKIGNPAREGTSHGWCQWKFVAAWCWGKWLADGDKPADMHKDLRRMGYQGNGTAFRQMMKRMGLVTHSKASESQQTKNE